MKKIARRERIVVVGSLNIDHVAKVERLPRPGETIGSNGFELLRGGKGANQALAVARQNGRVNLIGCVGDDAGGRDYLAFLRRSGVATATVRCLPNRGTGAAMITVDSRGENQIVLVPGANAHLTAAMVRAHARTVQRASALLVQFETSLEAVIAACEIAAAAHVRIVVNPSPWRNDFPWGAFPVSTVVVNETEAAQLFRLKSFDFQRHAAAIFRRMAQGAIGETVITRGSHSTLCWRDGRLTEIAALRVTPVDTVGAGDTFAGTLTVHLAEGAALAQAARFANCAAAMATLKVGAQGSIPNRRAVDRVARENFE